MRKTNEICRLCPRVLTAFCSLPLPAPHDAPETAAVLLACVAGVKAGNVTPPAMPVRVTRSLGSCAKVWPEIMIPAGGNGGVVTALQPQPRLDIASVQ